MRTGRCAVGTPNSATKLRQIARPFTDLAGVAEELADVDKRAAELDGRITQLLTMAAAP